MSYEQISTTLNDNILTLTLNRPEKLNAFTRIMLNEMIDVFEHDGRSPLDARFGGHDMFGWM
jgi:enoyl-CoA hydratase/carnithine racemase